MFFKLILFVFIVYLILRSVGKLFVVGNSTNSQERKASSETQFTRNKRTKSSINTSKIESIDFEEID